MNNLLLSMKDIDPNSLISPFLQFGIVGSLCVVFAIVIWRLYVTHKAEILALNVERDKERKYLFDKLDDARKDSIDQANNGHQELLGVSNKFIEITNDLKQFYASKMNLNG
jgi:hypothetical protein